MKNFDPSGEDMGRDLEDRLTRYGATDFAEPTTSRAPWHRERNL